MNINTSKGKRILFVLSFCMLLIFVLSAMTPNAHAQETGSITVLKRWEAEGSVLPEAVTLYLKRGENIVNALSLSGANAQADGSWLGSFENVELYDDADQPIEYSIAEEPVPNYSFSVTQQPRAESLTINRWNEKVTPANQSSYPIGSANLLVANKGGSYYVWTEDSLTQGQKSRLLTAVNAASLQGFGKELSLSNTSFAHGLPASFEGGVTLAEQGGSVYVNFENTNVWSLFYSGSYQLLRAQRAETLNRANVVLPTPTAVPSTPPTIQPTPVVTPTPAPTLPPQTGDTASQTTMITLSAALVALSLLMRKLKKA